MCIALTLRGRNPQKESKWRDELQAMGATISIESVDVADLKDVLRLRDELARTMPPIAGVVNGAMVLSDGIFADMSLESLQKVLRPKVQGSKNLDEAFSGHELDFFMMFSSLTAVAGNRGQGNYAAANMVTIISYKFRFSISLIIDFNSIWPVLRLNDGNVVWSLRCLISECLRALGTLIGKKAQKFITTFASRATGRSLSKTFTTCL